jgi:hypothetical protein
VRGWEGWTFGGVSSELLLKDIILVLLSIRIKLGVLKTIHLSLHNHGLIEDTRTKDTIILGELTIWELLLHCGLIEISLSEIDV